MIAAALALALAPSPSAAPGFSWPEESRPAEPAFSDGPWLRREAIAGPISAKVTRIVDGDTFEARIRVWFGMEVTTLVRLRGYDAPEMKAHCALEAAGADAARIALADYLASGPVTLSDLAPDKYAGRVLAHVQVADAAAPSQPPEDVSSLMLATAEVRPYAGGTRQSWCVVQNP